MQRVEGKSMPGVAGGNPMMQVLFIYLFGFPVELKHGKIIL